MNYYKLCFTIGHCALAALYVLVVLTLIQSPNANTLSNLLCYKVYGLTSTNPFSSVNLADINSLCGLLGGLITAAYTSFSTILPLSTHLNTAIFSP
jgi:hypothetical protein